MADSNPIKLSDDKEMRSLHIRGTKVVAYIKQRRFFRTRFIPLREVWITHKVFMYTDLTFPKIKNEADDGMEG